MTPSPARWSLDELGNDSALSSSYFRNERLAVSDAWSTHYKGARAKFELLFQKLNNLNPDAVNDGNLADAYGSGLSETLRYLAGPPISDDDLQVIANVKSITPGILKNNPEELRKVFDVIERVIDPFRFPWIQASTY